MICYIKSMKDFKTIEKYDIVEYSISDGEDGSIKVATSVPVKTAAIYSGCWMVIPFIEKERTDIPYEYLTETASNGGISVDILGKDLKVKENVLPDGGIEYVIDSFYSVQKHKVFFISECTPENDSLSFTIKHPIYAFTRRILYTGETTWGPFLNKVFNDGFGCGCKDRNFAMRYLTIDGTSSEECEIETDSYGYFVPSDYLEYARRIGINIDFSVLKNDRLLVSISDAQREYGIVLFNDGHSQLQDETYAANTYSKVTILQELQEQGPIIGASETKSISNYNANFSIEVAQDIVNSYSSRKSMLLVRVVSSWSDASSAISFSNSDISVKLDSSSGTSLLNSTFNWELKTDPGYSTSDWLQLSQLDERSSCKLYVSISPDHYPGGTEASSYSTLTYFINVSDIIARSSIKFGPLDSDYNRAMYRLIDFYLSKNGSISTEVPEELADGEWLVYNISSDDIPIYQASDIFSQNSDNHKIEFYSDQYFEYYQPIRMRIRTGVFETMITSRTVSSSDKRYYYKCGRLLTRLTEKVKALNGG